MALRRGFRGPAMGARPKRINKWGFGPDARELQVSSSGAALWTSGIQLTVESEATLVRIRGNGLVYLNTASVVDDGYRWAAGIALVSDEAFVAGVASVPDPRDDNEADWDGWIWHRFGYLHSPLVGITAGAQQSGADGLVERFVIDSKAMRKWSNGYTLMGVLGQTETGTATMVFHATTRLLVKLH